MPFPIILLFALVFAPLAWAQNTAQPETPPSAAKSTVTLEAKTLQIVLNDEHRQGVDWEAIVSDFHSLQLNKEGDVAWFDKKYTLSIGEVSKDDYSVLLEALDTVGRVDQTDFQPLVIPKGETKIYDVSPAPDTPPTIKLELSWTHSPSGEAKIKITPILGVNLKDASANTISLLKSQTELNLKDNTTIVIGSLMNEEEYTRTKKFPVLGNLPLVGLVFRKQGKLMHKTETMIFLKVHTDFGTAPEEQK
jgi:hypothetical protein